MDSQAFSILDTEQIVSHLTLLQRNNCLLTAQFGKNNESFITAIVAIDKKNQSIILDYGPKEYLNQQILTASPITFSTEYNGIKAAFSGNALKKVTHEDGPALSMPIPASLFWRQRREFYRVKSPLSKASYCQLTLPEREPVLLKLHDISLSGFAVLNYSQEISSLLLPTSQFDQCQLILADAGTDSIAFEVRYKILLNTGFADFTQKIGCKFTHLSPAFESVIQRYMQQIERDSR